LSEQGEKNESTGISKEDLPQLQDRYPQARGSRHLLGTAAQATSGLIEQNRLSVI
jgi:hypothetical protein